MYGLILEMEEPDDKNVFSKFTRIWFYVNYVSLKISSML